MTAIDATRDGAGAPTADAVPVDVDDVEAILAWARARLALRAAWLRQVWEREGPSAGPFGITDAQADAALADVDAPAAEVEWLTTAPEAAALLAATTEADAALLDAPRLQLLAQVLGLDAVEVEVLALCVAVAVDPSIARVLAYLRDDATRPQVSSALAARVVGTGRTLPLAADGGLLRWGLVEQSAAPGEPDVLVCDPFVVAWLAGDGSLDPALVGVVGLQALVPPLSVWRVDELARRLDAQLADGSHPVRVAVEGVAGSGRRSFAAAVAATLGLPLLAVDADAVADADWAATVLRVHRQAYLDRSAVAWCGTGVADRRWPADVAPFPLQFALVEPGRTLDAHGGVIEAQVALDLPGADDRRALWAWHLPATTSWPAGTLDQLALRRRSTPGQIAAAARTTPRDADAADRALRAASAPVVDGLVERMECPFERDDLVVADHVNATLDELVYEAEVRVELWERPSARRHYPAGRGIVALFSGVPGTGKTMAAQVIARRLHAELLRIDLSTIVSKWVGETSENIDRVLRQVSGTDAVLLFDEADALYGKRASDVNDAQDRYVNIDTGHLMVAIERFDGVVLLATNQKSAMDPAFTRRIRYVVEFPTPDVEQRLEIWRRTMVALLGRRPGKRLDGALATVADSVELTGAQIKSAALSAVLSARRHGRSLQFDDLAAGVSRELTKVGRSLTARDLDRMVRREG